jgi:uncharacterized protein with von Willebrand factor type A (vWA) domain
MQTHLNILLNSSRNLMNIFRSLGRVIPRVSSGVTTGLSAASLLIACATASPPTEQMALSRAAVSNATSAGGNEYAPIQLKSAVDKMDAAERALNTKDYIRARQLAEQAQVDAQLAEATARSAQAKKAADALQEDSRILRQEIDRKTTTP